MGHKESFVDLESQSLQQASLASRGLILHQSQSVRRIGSGSALDEVELEGVYGSGSGWVLYLKLVREWKGIEKKCVDNKTSEETNSPGFHEAHG